MSDVNWNDVANARNSANQQSTDATNFAAGGASLIDELRKAVGERFAQSPVAQDAAQARSNFLAAAPQARSDILKTIQGGTILSPTEQNAIMAAKRGAALVPLDATNTIQNAVFGSMQDLIGAGTNAYNAEAQRRQGLADLAQKNYQNILDEVYKRSQLANQGGMSAIDLALKKAQLMNMLGGNLSAAQKTQIAGYKSALDQLNQIANVYKTSGVQGKTGILPGLLANLGLGVGITAGPVADFAQKIAPFRTQLMNSLIGSQMSKAEMQLVQGWIPQPTDSQRNIENKLNNLKSFLDSKINAFYPSGGMDLNSLGIGGGSDWELVQ